MKKINNFLLRLFSSSRRERDKLLGQIKRGDIFLLKTSCNVGVCKCECMNNLPQDRTIHLIAYLSDGVEKNCIFDYDHNCFDVYKVLNILAEECTSQDLKRQLEFALDQQDYRKAQEIQNKINSLK